MAVQISSVPIQKTNYSIAFDVDLGWIFKHLKKCFSHGKTVKMQEKCRNLFT